MFGATRFGKLIMCFAFALGITVNVLTGEFLAAGWAFVALIVTILFVTTDY